MRCLLMAVGWSLAFPLPASAQSTISLTERHVYAANAGWIDFRPSAADGVVVTETYLAGKAYAANFGWIDFGDGSPANGHTYANDSGTDFGVNLNPNGQLTGYAYGANIGWIQFEQSQGKPQLAFITGKITGSVYAANLGWIVLDTASSDLATTTIAVPDTDGDGIADPFEKLHAGNLTTMTAISDSDGDGAGDLAEYAANTDPNNPASRLQIVAQSHNIARARVILTFTTSPNRLYSIEHDADLTAPWTDSGLGWFAPDAGATTVRDFFHPGGPKRFFRVSARLPLQP